MVDCDIYDDLELLHAEEQQKNIEDLKWKDKYEVALATLEKLQAEKKELNKKIKRLEINFSSLLDTARTEIKRKDNLIAELRREKDDICFRRNVRPAAKNSADESIRDHTRNEGGHFNPFAAKGPQNIVPKRSDEKHQPIASTSRQRDGGYERKDLRNKLRDETPVDEKYVGSSSRKRDAEYERHDKNRTRSREPQHSRNDRERDRSSGSNRGSLGRKDDRQYDDRRERNDRALSYTGSSDSSREKNVKSQNKHPHGGHHKKEINAPAKSLTSSKQENHTKDKHETHIDLTKESKTDHGRSNENLKKKSVLVENPDNHQTAAVLEADILKDVKELKKRKLAEAEKEPPPKEDPLKAAAERSNIFLDALFDDLTMNNDKDNADDLYEDLEAQPPMNNCFDDECVANDDDIIKKTDENCNIELQLRTPLKKSVSNILDDLFGPSPATSTSTVRKNSVSSACESSSDAMDCVKTNSQDKPKEIITASKSKKFVVADLSKQEKVASALPSKTTDDSAKQFVMKYIQQDAGFYSSDEEEDKKSATTVDPSESEIESPPFESCTHVNFAKQKDIDDATRNTYCDGGVGSKRDAEKKDVPPSTNESKKEQSHKLHHVGRHHQEDEPYRHSSDKNEKKADKHHHSSSKHHKSSSSSKSQSSSSAKDSHKSDKSRNDAERQHRHSASKKSTKSKHESRGSEKSSSHRSSHSSRGHSKDSRHHSSRERRDEKTSTRSKDHEEHIPTSVNRQSLHDVISLHCDDISDEEGVEVIREIPSPSAKKVIIDVGAQADDDDDVISLHCDEISDEDDMGIKIKYKQKESDAVLETIDARVMEKPIIEDTIELESENLPNNEKSVVLSQSASDKVALCNSKSINHTTTTETRTLNKKIRSNIEEEVESRKKVTTETAKRNVEPLADLSIAVTSVERETSSKHVEMRSDCIFIEDNVEEPPTTSDDKHKNDDDDSDCIFLKDDEDELFVSPVDDTLTTGEKAEFNDDTNNLLVDGQNSSNEVEPLPSTTEPQENTGKYVTAEVEKPSSRLTTVDSDRPMKERKESSSVNASGSESRKEVEESVENKPDTTDVEESCLSAKPTEDPSNCVDDCASESRMKAEHSSDVLEVGEPSSSATGDDNVRPRKEGKEPSNCVDFSTSQYRKEKEESVDKNPDTVDEEGPSSRPATGDKTESRKELEELSNCVDVSTAQSRKEADNSVNNILVDANKELMSPTVGTTTPMEEAEVCTVNDLTADKSFGDADNAPESFDPTLEEPVEFKEKADETINVDAAASDVGDNLRTSERVDSNEIRETEDDCVSKPTDASIDKIRFAEKVESLDEFHVPPAEEDGESNPKSTNSETPQPKSRNYELAPANENIKLLSPTASTPRKPRISSDATEEHESQPTLDAVLNATEVHKEESASESGRRRKLKTPRKCTDDGNILKEPFTRIMTMVSSRYTKSDDEMRSKYPNCTHQRRTQSVENLAPADVEVQDPTNSLQDSTSLLVSEPNTMEVNPESCLVGEEVEQQEGYSIITAGRKRKMHKLLQNSTDSDEQDIEVQLEASQLKEEESVVNKKRKKETTQDDSRIHHKKRFLQNSTAEDETGWVKKSDEKVKNPSDGTTLVNGSDIKDQNKKQSSVNAFGSGVKVYEALPSNVGSDKTLDDDPTTVKNNEEEISESTSENKKKQNTVQNSLDHNSTAFDTSERSFPNASVDASIENKRYSSNNDITTTDTVKQCSINSGVKDSLAGESVAHPDVQHNSPAASSGFVIKDSEEVHPEESVAESNLKEKKMDSVDGEVATKDSQHEHLSKSGSDNVATIVASDNIHQGRQGEEPVAKNDSSNLPDVKDTTSCNKRRHLKKPAPNLINSRVKSSTEVKKHINSNVKDAPFTTRKDDKSQPMNSAQNKTVFGDDKDSMAVAASDIQQTGDNTTQKSFDLKDKDVPVQSKDNKNQATDISHKSNGFDNVNDSVVDVASEIHKKGEISSLISFDANGKDIPQTVSKDNKSHTTNSSQNSTGFDDATDSVADAASDSRKRRSISSRKSIDSNENDVPVVAIRDNKSQTTKSPQKPTGFGDDKDSVADEANDSRKRRGNSSRKSIDSNENDAPVSATKDKKSQATNSCENSTGSRADKDSEADSSMDRKKRGSSRESLDAQVAAKEDNNSQVTNSIGFNDEKKKHSSGKSMDGMATNTSYNSTGFNDKHAVAMDSTIKGALVSANKSQAKNISCNSTGFDDNDALVAAKNISCNSTAFNDNNALATESEKVIPSNKKKHKENDRTVNDSNITDNQTAVQSSEQNLQIPIGSVVEDSVANVTTGNKRVRKPGAKLSNYGAAGPVPPESCSKDQQTLTQSVFNDPESLCLKKNLVVSIEKVKLPTNLPRSAATKDSTGDQSLNTLKNRQNTDETHLPCDQVKSPQMDTQPNLPEVPANMSCLNESPTQDGTKCNAIYIKRRMKPSRPPPKARRRARKLSSSSSSSDADDKNTLQPINLRRKMQNQEQSSTIDSSPNPQATAKRKRSLSHEKSLTPHTTAVTPTHHKIFNDDVFPEHSNLPPVYNANEDDVQYREIDNRMRFMFQSPKNGGGCSLDTSKINLTVDETLNQSENSQSDRSFSSRKISVGSNDYIIETVSENTAHVYISRKRCKKRMKVTVGTT